MLGFVEALRAAGPGDPGGDAGGGLTVQDLNHDCHLRAAGGSERICVGAEFIEIAHAISIAV
jgi:hypothetical protein